MNNAISVQDITAKIMLYLDNELDPTESETLLQQIQMNAEFRCILERHRALKQSIKENTTYHTAPSELIQSLRYQIQNLSSEAVHQQQY